MWSRAVKTTEEGGGGSTKRPAWAKKVLKPRQAGPAHGASTMPPKTVILGGGEIFLGQDKKNERSHNGVTKKKGGMLGYARGANARGEENSKQKNGLGDWVPCSKEQQGKTRWRHEKGKNKDQKQTLTFAESGKIKRGGPGKGGEEGEIKLAAPQRFGRARGPAQWGEN